MYMDQRFGAWQVGADPDRGAVRFRVFFPDSLKDGAQYERGGDPKISSIHAVGSFQRLLGQTDWDKAAAPRLIPVPHAQGTVFEFTTPPLPAGFYEYKYLVTFEDGQTRLVGDPCTRYGGSENQNSGVVVGGSPPQPVKRIATRRHLRDLVLYELMIDDFTDEYRRGDAPIDAVNAKLDHIANLGVNAVLFMPWTAWPGDGFNWGYNPYQYFSVEYRYVNAIGEPAEKLSRLKALIAACHDRGLHVVMDGVFNHVGDSSVDAKGNAFGFPYKWLYQDPADCPYAGTFGGTFPGLQDLDFHNGCTQQFVRDVCLYWIDNFGIDGIRLDNTVNFFIEDDARGLPTLLSDIRGHCADEGIENFSLTLEHLIGYEAASVVNRKGATSCWYNALYERAFDQLYGGNIDGRLMRALNTHLGFDADKLATTYIGNHDHSHVAWQAGARTNSGALEWYRTQPWVIALLTCPGVPMVQNGQEFAEDYWIMEDDRNSNRRVKPRPLRWDFANDNIGSKLLQLYRKLIALRLSHPGLRSNEFYPYQETWETKFNPQGYGVDAGRNLAIYHRWGTGDDGRLERFIVVLNFGPQGQATDVPFPADGRWVDVLNEDQPVDVVGFWLRDWTVNANWGSIFLQRA